MREGHAQPFRILARAVDHAPRSAANTTRSVDGLRRGIAELRREAAPPGSEPASLANRTEEAFSRALRTDTRLDEDSGQAHVAESS